MPEIISKAKNQEDNPSVFAAIRGDGSAAFFFFKISRSGREEPSHSFLLSKTEG